MSKRFSLNKRDLTKIAKGAGIALGGAAITYIGQVAGQVNFGVWTPFVVGGISVIINAVQKYLAPTDEPKEADVEPSE